MARSLNLIDRFVAWASPERAAKRAYYRQAVLPAIEASYAGGVPTRLDRQWATGGFSMFGLRSVERQQVRSMRDRARHLDNDNALASAILDRATENVIGVGIRLEARATNKDGSLAKPFNDQVNGLWKRFWRVCDVRGLLSFGAMQQLAYRQYLLDGDTGIVLMTDDFGVPRLQLIESQDIITPDGKAGDARIIDGVEVNALGRPIAFHIRKGTEIGPVQTVRVEARDFIFLPRIRRPYQVRGLTVFAQAFPLFDNIMGYMEATTVAARVGASQALIIQRPASATAFGNMETATNSRGVQQAIETIEPGQVRYGAPGETVAGFNPTQPTQSFPEAIAAMARFVGLNFGITLEQVMLDFSRTNYSSARAARLQAEQTAYCEQENFYHVVLARIWNWIVSKWVNGGEVTGEIPDSYWEHEWIPQGRPWVDPTKEVDAAIREVKELRTNTRSNIATEHGWNFEKLVEENAKDEQLLKDADLLTDATTQPQGAYANDKQE